MDRDSVEVKGFLFIEFPCQLAVIKHGDSQAVRMDAKISWRFCLWKSLQEDKSHKWCVFPSAGGGWQWGRDAASCVTLGVSCPCPQVSPTAQGVPEVGTVIVERGSELFCSCGRAG